MTDTTAARRALLTVLLDRVERGALLPAEAPLLRPLVAAEQADANRAADYENRLTWETTCGEHARLLDACRAADERAEQAEATITHVRKAVALARKHANPLSLICFRCGADGDHLADIAAALDGEQQDEPEPEHDSVKQVGHWFPMPTGAAECYGFVPAVCRRMDTRTCPPTGPCAETCARFDSDDPAPWQQPDAPAVRRDNAPGDATT